MMHFASFMLLYAFNTSSCVCENIYINGSDHIVNGHNVSLNCSVNKDLGVELKWKLPDEQLQNEHFVKDSETWTVSVLNIQNYTAAVEGNYICIVTKGSLYNGDYNCTLKIFRNDKSNQEHNANYFLIICFAMLITAIFTVTCSTVKRIMFRTCSNGYSGIEEQLDLLPNVKIFDFPKLQLKLGNELGFGKFGVVCKAEAIGMINDVTTTTVCVKMAKSNTDQTHINALRSELEIMIRIGMHLNIVNLLGAYTGSINKKLMIITEYCRFGNIHYYLSRQRNSFINQITPDGILDFNIYTTSRNPYSLNKDKYNYYPGKHDESSTQMIDVNEYLIPGETKWYMNYHGDCESYNNIKPSCTYDLVCWSLQIARGMEYVASKKIFQFNLTARNILLAEGNIVKICDFESSTIISDDENYKMMSFRDLKWLAIESLRDKVYLTKSNVWTFGIVLWEIFSLGATPYPNVGVKDLLNALVRGHRMEQPLFANKRIFDIMLNCWRTDPSQRPSFKEVAYNLGSLLKRGTISYLANLNDNYVKLNDEKLPTKDYSILIPVTSTF